jgi:hypothetical protein
MPKWFAHKHRREDFAGQTGFCASCLCNLKMQILSRSSFARIYYPGMKRKSNGNSIFLLKGTFSQKSV